METSGAVVAGVVPVVIVAWCILMAVVCWWWNKTKKAMFGLPRMDDDTVSLTRDADFRDKGHDYQSQASYAQVLLQNTTSLTESGALKRAEIMESLPMRDKSRLKKHLAIIRKKGKYGSHKSPKAEAKVHLKGKTNENHVQKNTKLKPQPRTHHTLVNTKQLPATKPTPKGATCQTPKVTDSTGSPQGLTSKNPDPIPPMANVSVNVNQLTVKSPNGTLKIETPRTAS